jgi:hypothetical protein
MHSSLEEIRGEDGSLPAYAWPGGYPIAYFADSGETFCPECANQDEAEPEITAWDIHCEGQPLQCDGCSKEIASAYGDPDEVDAS